MNGGAATSRADDRSARIIPFALVGAQFACLIALFLAPGGTLWPTGRGTAAAVIGSVTQIAGVAVMVAGAWTIRRSLSVLPVPTEHAELRVNGAFRVARHPIYTGLLLLGASLALGRASVLAIALVITLALVLWIKSSYEERMLRARFPEYAAYAERTGRFVPRPAQLVRLVRRDP